MANFASIFGLRTVVTVGGGSSTNNLVPLSVKSNGTYYPENCDGFSMVTVEVSSDIIEPSFRGLNLKLGDTFYLDYDGSSPEVYISNEGILTYYDDGGTIPFTAIGVGSCTVELREDKGEGEYVVLARASVTVEAAEGGDTVEDYDGTIIIEDNFDFVVKVGDSINLPVDPESGQEIGFTNNSVLEGYNDGGVWQVKAIGVGTCTIYINSDADEPDYTFVVKVLESEEPSEPTPTLISFTIDGVSYQAEDGMTWGEWLESEYNTDGYVVGQAGNSIDTSDNLSGVYSSSSGYVSKNSTINADEHYVLSPYTGGAA
jgi:hypothetical protein